MTGKLIFKMEMFKFFKDRVFIITAAVIGLLNILVTLFYISAFNAPDKMFDVADGAIIGLVSLFSFFLILANAALIFIYPFHAVSSDYKNNVLALMVASGVDRKKLYMSKVGAIIVAALILTAVTILIPFIMVSIQIAVIGDWDGAFEIIMEAFAYLNFDFFKIILIGFLSYFSSLLIMIYSTILLKGSKLAILLYIGFSMGVSFVRSILSVIVLLTGVSFSWFTIITMLLTVVLFVFLSLRTVQRQNL